MNLELISFKLCPFVQSSITTLLYQGIEYKITFIDINDPPQWFDEVSPTAQVPILRVDNNIVIFESTVINEFLNDIGNRNMIPDEPLQRAAHRSWTQFCSAILGDIFNLIGAKNQEAFEDIEYDILDKLDKLEAVKTHSTYFGDNLNLIDTIYAALFMRLNLLKPAHDMLDISRYPKLTAWSQQLLDLECVKKSVVPELPQIYISMVKMREGYISQLLS